MPFVDRTNDFFNAVSAVSSQTKPISRAHNHHQSAQPTTFGTDASRCRELISRAERGLDRMRQLGQKSSVFDDPSAEISDLSTSIQQDLKQISHKIQQLSAMAGSANQSGMLASLNSSAMTITQDLASALRERAERLKTTEQHRQAFGGSTGPAWGSERGGGLRARHKSSSLHVEMAMPGGLEDDSAADDDACVINLPSAVEMQQQHMRNPRRTAAVEGAEKMIGELATTFHKMTGLVSHQAEMLGGIDSHLDTSMDNVEQAQTSLASFLDGITGNRPLVIKTFATLIMFAVFFCYFLR